MPGLEEAQLRAVFISAFQTELLENARIVQEGIHGEGAMAEGIVQMVRELFPGIDIEKTSGVTAVAEAVFSALIITIKENNQALAADLA